MARKDKLLDLIHTLSMSEKRYFSIFAQRHVTKGNTRYQELFELACNLESTDPDQFEHSIREAGIQADYLAADKNYLYNLVMRSLSNFHASRTKSMQVKEWLHQVEILFDKGLYDQCLTLTTKARQAAEEYDLYALLMEISLWERKVLGELNEITRIKESHSTVLEHLGFMDNMHAFMLLYYQLLELAQEYQEAPEDLRRQALDKFIAHPFLRSDTVPMSFHATRHFWMIYALYYRLVRDKQQELAALEKLVAVMDLNAQYREEYPYDYVDVYSRILNLKLYDDSPDFAAWLTFFREFPAKLKKAPRNVQARISLDSYLFEVPWLLRNGQTDLVPDALHELTVAQSQYRRQVSLAQQLEILFWTARYDEAVGDPAQAIASLTPLLNEFRADEGTDIQLFGRILAMQAHYQRENYSILPYIADSSLRMISKQKDRFVLEAWVIRQFRRLAKVEFRGQRYARLIFQGMLDQWNEKSSEASSSRLEEYLDIPTWVRQHLP